MSLSRYFDRIAIALSAVCIVHCVTVPLLAAVLPIAFVSLGAEAHFHEWMLWGVVPTSVLGFALGFRYHRLIWIGGWGIVGLAIIAFAAVVAHDAWSWWQELLVNVIGSVVLAVAHWKNFIEVRRAHIHE